MTSTDRGGNVSARLADFPWDLLAPLKARALEHPDGLVDLSVGTPVDPTPEPVQTALAASADSPGYPLTAGSEALTDAIRWTVKDLTGTNPVGILPTVGSKEFIALLPTLLGFGPADRVVIPAVAYPTYRVGAELAGAAIAVADDPMTLDAGPRTLVWLNSPSNPTGGVTASERLREWVSWARENDALVASDECYAQIWWERRPPSILDREVNDGDQSGLLAVFSLSKRSNLAGYRSGFVAGDGGLVAELLAVRKHLGLMVPGPVQAATVAALRDPGHVAAQVAKYGERRGLLHAALLRAGFRVDLSEAGLYLWASRDEDCWRTAAWFADRGILVAPGAFYGAAGQQHIRLALTVTDERLASGIGRL